MIFLLCLSVASLRIKLNNQENFFYTLSSKFGTPSQELILSVSTHSPVNPNQYTWVPENLCSPCHIYKDRFDPGESSTFTTMSRSLIHFEFMTGFVSGNLVSDFQSFEGSFSLKSQFLLVSKEYELDNLKSDGGLGLCPGSGYIESLYNLGLVNDTFFSLYFSDNGFRDEETSIQSELLIAEIDMKFTREQEGQTIDTEGCWEINVLGLAIDSFYLHTNSTGYFDSSFWYIMGPKKEVIFLLQAFIQNYKCGFGNHGFLTCECSSLSRFMDIVFLINGKSLILTAKKYFIEDSGNCIFLFTYSNSETMQYWKFGMPFFREYYGVFNMHNSSITFYRSAFSKIIADEEYKIKRWVTITITISVIVLFGITLYFLYSLFCKPISSFHT